MDPRDALIYILMEELADTRALLSEVKREPEWKIGIQDREYLGRIYIKESKFIIIQWDPLYLCQWMQL